MASIYNTKDNQELIERLNKLTPESQALWGKMSVDQMLSHCIAPIDVALGNSQLKKPNLLIGFLGKMMKNKIINGNVFKKNSPTAPSFIREKSYDFDITRNELIEKVQQFKQGASAIKCDKHPFFGKMSVEDWDKLQWKHLNHHLEQFGV